MDTFAGVIASLAALSLLVTKTVDLIRNFIDADGNAPKWLWNVAAFAVGVAYCLGWQVNITATVFGLVPALANSRLDGVAGQILSGIALGGLSGFAHELLDALSGIAERLHSE